MALGPNFAGIDKGFAITDTGAYARGQVCVLDTPPQSVKKATGALAAGQVAGICQIALRESETATRKAFVNVRLFGLSEAITGGPIVKGDKITSDAQGRVVKATAAPYLGYAVESQPNVGQLVDVFINQNG